MKHRPVFELVRSLRASDISPVPRGQLAVYHGILRDMSERKTLENVPFLTGFSRVRVFNSPVFNPSKQFNRAEFMALRASGDE